jgi:hypothetical protein
MDSQTQNDKTGTGGVDHPNRMNPAINIRQPQQTQSANQQSQHPK